MWISRKQNTNKPENGEKETLLKSYWGCADPVALKQKEKEICVIIPCYNEEKRLNFQAFQDFFARKEDAGKVMFLFVDDGSRDGTTAFLKSWTENLPDSSVGGIQLRHNCGKAEAIRQGVLYALQKADFHWIGYWDADLSTPLEDILMFREHLCRKNHLQMVMGSRCKYLGCNVKRSLFRHFTGRVAATLISMKLNLPVYDTQCGAKLFTVSLAKQYFQTKFHSAWLFDAELLLRIIRGNDRAFALKVLEEVPVSCWIHKAGSKINFWDAGIQLLGFLFL